MRKALLTVLGLSLAACSAETAEAPQTASEELTSPPMATAARPAVGMNEDGRLEVFFRGADGAPYHIWQDSSAPSGWSNAQSMGGATDTAIAVASNADGRLEAFTRDSNRGLAHDWQSKPNSGWSGWNSMGGIITSDPTVGRNADGTLAVFTQATNGNVALCQQHADGSWSWSFLGTDPVASPASVGTNADGRLEVFARAPGGGLMHNWQSAPNGNFTMWLNLGGGITTDPSVVRDAHGNLSVFAGTADGSIAKIAQTGNGGWSSWTNLGGRGTSATTAAINPDGRLEVFVRGTDNSLLHDYEVSPGGAWSGWSSLGGTILSAPTVATMADGKLAVFAVGYGGTPMMIAQSATSGWTSWQSLAGTHFRENGVYRGPSGKVYFAKNDVLYPVPDLATGLALGGDIDDVQPLPNEAQLGEFIGVAQSSVFPLHFSRTDRIDSNGTETTNVTISNTGRMDLISVYEKNHWYTDGYKGAVMVYLFDKDGNVLETTPTTEAGWIEGLPNTNTTATFTWAPVYLQPRTMDRVHSVAIVQMARTGNWPTAQDLSNMLTIASGAADFVSKVLSFL